MNYLYISIRDCFVAFGINYMPSAMIPLLRGSNALALKCRSTRMCGSAALNLAFTSCGIFNAWFEIDLSPWDVSAGALLVMEAGGRVTGLHGEPYTLRTVSLLASSGVCHDEILQILKEANATDPDPNATKV